MRGFDSPVQGTPTPATPAAERVDRQPSKGQPSKAAALAKPYRELAVASSGVGHPPAPQPASSSSAAELLQRAALHFEKQWLQAHNQTERRIRALDPSLRPVFELQTTVQELGLKTNLVSQLGETMSSTLRRLQQLGSA